MHRINLLFLYFLIFYAAYAHGQTSSAKPIKLRPADEALQPVVSYLSGLDLLKDSSLVRGTLPHSAYEGQNRDSRCQHPYPPGIP